MLLISKNCYMRILWLFFLSVLFLAELSKLKLVRLDFSYNKVSVIPPAYRLITSLSVLELAHNPLTSPPAQVLNLYIRSFKISCFLKNLAAYSTNHDLLPLVTSSSAWFIGLSVSFMIGYSDYFGFGIRTFFTECHKTKIEPVTYQLDCSSSLKLYLNQNQRNCLIAFNAQLKTTLDVWQSVKKTPYNSVPCYIACIAGGSGYPRGLKHGLVVRALDL